MMMVMIRRMGKREKLNVFHCTKHTHTSEQLQDRKEMIS